MADFDYSRGSVHNRNEAFLSEELKNFYEREVSILKGLVDYCPDYKESEWASEMMLASVHLESLKENYVPLPSAHIDEARVWCTPEFWGATIPYDGKEGYFDATNPQPARVKRLAAAARRITERKIVQTMIGENIYGKNSFNTLKQPFRQDMIIPHNDQGLTDKKWNLAKVRLDTANSEGGFMQSPCLLTTSYQLSDMVELSDSRNRDFNNDPRKLPGLSFELPYWSGMYNITLNDHAERKIGDKGNVTNLDFDNNTFLPRYFDQAALGGNGAWVRRCIAFNKNALKYADVKSPSVRIINTDQTLGHFSGSKSLAMEQVNIGLRVDDFGVCIIECLEVENSGVRG